MKFFVLISFFTILTEAYSTVFPFAAKNDEEKVKESTVMQVWPLPQSYVINPTFLVISPEQFEILTSSKCDIVQHAVELYKKKIFSDCSNQFSSKKIVYKVTNHDQLLNLSIKIKGPCDEYPTMNMNEEYLLKINTSDAVNRAVLFSTTVWGVLRGLETFSQLIYKLESGMFAIHTGSILDYPRFSFRGLMLDTSRHFVPVPKILENLDLMAQTKLNVFHWHIVDDPSFPFVSGMFPDLSKKGSFNSDTHIYTPSDIKTVIEYARLRGIRVLVEFDTPGHTLSWGKGNPDLLTACYNGSVPNGLFGPIDPTKKDTYDFLQSLFGEVVNVFPDAYLHLGGDEVSFDCWASNPFIQSFMKAKKFGQDFALLEGYYVTKLLDIIRKLNKSYIVWQEVFDNNVKIKPDTVVHIWKDYYQSELSNVTKAGYNAILSACWYLSDFTYGKDWVSYYACDPHDFNGTSEQKKLVIGGEACMWGEYVDGSNVISRTWPRAATVAERLWSNESITDATEAAVRLEKLRCYMIKNGYKVEPVNGPGFCECDFLP